MSTQIGIKTFTESQDQKRDSRPNSGPQFTLMKETTLIMAINNQL
jgi:hypothetical protein